MAQVAITRAVLEPFKGGHVKIRRGPGECFQAQIRWLRVSTRNLSIGFGLCGKRLDEDRWVEVVLEDFKSPLGSFNALSDGKVVQLYEPGGGLTLTFYSQGEYPVDIRELLRIPSSDAGSAAHSRPQ